MSRSSRQWVSGGLLVLLAIGLLAVLISQISMADILRLLRNLTLPQLLVLLALYAAATVFRGLRLAMILGMRHPATLAAISGVHAFLNHLLPFRAGELSLPFLIRTFLGRSLAAGAVSLVLVRLYDTLSVALLMLLALAVAGPDLESRVATAIGWALTAVMACLVAAFVALPHLLRALHRALPAAGRWFGPRATSWASRLSRAVDRMQAQLGSLGPRNRYVWLPLTSLFAQSCIYGFFYLAMRSMGIDIGFFKNTLASSGEMITGLLPINMVGSVGTLEAGWAVGYVLCGIDRVDAIASGFVVHGLIVLSVLVISLASLAWLLANRWREARAPSPAPRGPPGR